MKIPHQQLLAHLMRDADPLNACHASFLHYHARGLHYLNLLRTPELTAKLYVVDPLVYKPNPDGFLVNPHDHAYDFETLVIEGGVRNQDFVETPSERGEQREERTWQRFTYTSATRTFERACVAYLRPTEAAFYKPGQTYYLPYDRVHTIVPVPGVATVLFLLQFARPAGRTQTNCYAKGHAMRLGDGLYEPMTPGRYRELLAYCADAVTRLAAHHLVAHEKE